MRAVEPDTAWSEPVGAPTGMSLAVLLWIYKEPRVCLNRARWLRTLNPGTPIYCLYGGPMADAALFEAALSGLIDDFFAFDRPWREEEKWLHGDRMLAVWHEERGAGLEWDTILIAQWDLVMTAPVRALCGTLKRDELLLPGLRTIAEVRSFWWWLRPGSPEVADYLAFEAELSARGERLRDPLCCNFLAAALPRRFMERYSKEAPMTGFLEYKVPMMAQAWNFPFCLDHAFNPVWLNERLFSRFERYWVTLHAEKEPVKTVVVAANRLWPWGKRVFHPYVKPLVPIWPSMGGHRLRA
jgi:hypothetical protein